MEFGIERSNTGAGRIVTNRPTEKLPILGKIKIGMKVPKKGNPDILIPTSLDYFRATGDYAAKFEKAFGDKCTSISIVFVSDNISEICNERLECRDGKGALMGYGDGQTFYLWEKKNNDDEGKYVPLKADTEENQKKIRSMGTWQQILTIKFIIPKINDVFGVWVFETKGKASSIPNIRDTFDRVMNMAGTVVNVPFDLTVKKASSQKPGVKRNFSTVELIPNVSKDRIEAIADFLQAGNNVSQITKLLQNKMENTERLLEPGTQKQLEQSNEAAGEGTVIGSSGGKKIDLFNNNK